MLTTDYKTKAEVSFKALFKTVHKITSHLLITNFSLTGKTSFTVFYNIRMYTL